MKDIMIATSNSGKVKEYKELLEPLGYKVHSLSEIEHIDIDENGTTFAQNALIKAKSVKDKCDMIVISDDSGLEIDALNKEPGIHSARYLQGYDYKYKNQVILDGLKNVENRSARFICAIALVDDKEHVFEGVMEGTIAYQPKGENGFGYDPIFVVPQYNKTSAEITSEQKNAVSHRGQATRKLIEYLKEKNI